MYLPADDIDLFFKLWFAVLAFTSRQYPGILSGERRPDEIRGMPLAQLKPLRDAVYDHPGIFDAFIAANPSKFPEEELAIVREWKHFVRGQFILLRQLKAYAIFVDMNEPPRAYGVLALNSSFEELTQLPAFVDAVLLPFKGKITYDGIINYSPIVFGRNYINSFNDTYQRAKSLYGIITALPYIPPEEQQPEIELLRFYMKSERNRTQYIEQTSELLHRNPSLLPVYHQELGKLNSRTYKRWFREQGLSSAWFAMLDNMVIASGKSQDEVNHILNWLLPDEKRQYAYVFHWKP